MLKVRRHIFIANLTTYYDHSIVEDYQSLPSELVFNLGAVTACGTIQTVADAIYEDDETITLTLISTNPSIVTDGSSTQVEIKDDDSKFFLLF